MSKIEDALEKASRLRQRSVSSPSNPSAQDTKGTYGKFTPRNEFIIDPDGPESPIAEEYRRLKSILIRETKADFKNSIMITSSEAGEGKTITSINLALAFAQEIDHSALLIDADLRNPMVSDYLGIHHEKGLHDYLTGHADSSEIIVDTDLPHLKLIPAGARSDHAGELLASSKMKSLMQDLKKQHVDRYIIVDTPPLISFADALTIASYVDGVVMVVRERGVKVKALTETMALLKPFKLFGVVFNGVSELNLNGRYTRYAGSSYRRK